MTVLTRWMYSFLMFDFPKLCLETVFRPDITCTVLSTAYINKVFHCEKENPEKMFDFLKEIGVFYKI